MGKKKSWFSYVKRLFLPQTKKPKLEEQSKTWTWIFEKIKFRRHHPHRAIEPPQKVLNVAAEEQRKCALAVAMATAAAAEAAVAAANAAAEVVRLTNIPYEIQTENQHGAAIRIQCAYRAHLAKKALKALKGVVKLQAVVRGELVRAKIIKSLSSNAFSSNINLRVHKRRVPSLFECLNYVEKTHSLGQMRGSKSQELRPHCSDRRSWNLTTVSKGETETSYLHKQETIAKRLHMKQYSFSQREQRSDRSQESIKKEIQFDPRQHEEKKKPKSRTHFPADNENRLSQLKLRTESKRENLDDEMKFPFSPPRRSFCHIKHKSIGDEESSPNSPAYMATTESARAKCRSMSTPRQRLSLWETYLGEHSPCKVKLSPWSSFNGEMSTTAKNNISHHHLFTTYGH